MTKPKAPTETQEEAGLSNWARKLKRLKTSALQAAESRERLPQPLFWSLFHSVISEVRRGKSRERTIREALEGGLSEPAASSLESES